MGQRCSLLNFGSKDQRSSSLDIKVAIWFSFKILEQSCEIEMIILCIWIGIICIFWKMLLCEQNDSILRPEIETQEMQIWDSLCGLWLCRLPALAEATYRDHLRRCRRHKIFCHIFLRNHIGELPDIWHRASVWTTVSCNAVSNLLLVNFLFDATLNIFNIHKFLSHFSQEPHRPASWYLAQSISMDNCIV